MTTKKKMQDQLKPNHILADHAPAIRKLAEEMRKLIKETVPDATEHTYPTWHAIGYRHKAAGYFCGIFPYDNHLKLYFEKGRRLPDPNGIMQGQNLKRTRYIEIRNLEDIRAAAIKRLLSQAIGVATGNP